MNVFLYIHYKSVKGVDLCVLTEAPKLAHETFRAMKPGLSAYADDPEKVTSKMCSSFIIVHPSQMPQGCDSIFFLSAVQFNDYINVVVQSKEGLLELLNVAKDTVPETLWSSSPLMLRATAGLRLLPGEKATILLDKVREPSVAKWTFTSFNTTNTTT